MKLLKIFFALLGITVLLVVAAIVIIPMLVDPNDFKGEIVQAVKDNTGRDLEIPGKIGLSVFPWLAVELGETRLSNAKGFGKAPFAEIKQASVRVKLMPLLKKQVQVDKVILDGVTLRLARDKAGKTNWDDLAGAGTTPSGQKPEPASGAPAIDALAIGGVQISDAILIWDDRQAGQHLELTRLNLTTGEIEPGHPVDLDLGFDVSSNEPVLDSGLRLTGTLSMNEALTLFQVSGLKLALDLRKGPDDMRGSLALAGEVQADTQAQRYRVEGLGLDVDLQGAGLPGGATKARLTGKADADLAAQTLQLTNLVLAAYGLDLKGHLDGSGLDKSPRFSGRFDVQPFKPRELLASLGQADITTADAKALDSASLGFDVQASDDSAKLSNIKLVLDQSTLTGHAGVQHFAKPAVRFGLKLDAIDVDRYLPPKLEGAKAEPPVPASADTATAAGAAELPTETLRALDVDGSVKVGKLKVSGLSAGDIGVTVQAKKGLLKTTQTVGRFYQGRYRSDSSLDVTGSKARWTTRQDLGGIQVGPLLKDLTGDDKLSGTGQVKANLKGQGIEPEAIKQGLNGTASFRFTDGAVKGINIARLFREFKAKLKGKTLPPDTAVQKTDFSEMKGSARITNGVVRNDDLEATSPLLRVRGKGKVDLPGNQIDYKLTAQLVGSLQGQGGKKSDELSGIVIPVHLTGALDNPSPGVDWNTLLADAGKAKLKDKAKKAIEKKLGDKLGGDEGLGGVLKKQLDGGDVGKALKGLF